YCAPSTHKKLSRGTHSICKSAWSTVVSPRFLEGTQINNETSWYQEKNNTSYVEAFFCHSFVGKWSRSACGTGNVRACRYKIGRASCREGKQRQRCKAK